jgi:hypothetical protein
VDEKTAQINRLTHQLKIYFPQMLEWFEQLDAELVCALLERWPTLEELQKVPPERRTTRRCEGWPLNGFASFSVAGKIGREQISDHARQTKLTADCRSWWGNAVKSLWTSCEQVREGR